MGDLESVLRPTELFPSTGSFCQRGIRESVAHLGSLLVATAALMYKP